MEKRLVTGPAREIDMSNVTFRCIFLQINLLNIDIPSRDIKRIIFPSLKFFSRGHLLLLLLSQKCLLFLSTSHNRVASNSNIHFYEDRNMQGGMNKCLTCCITSCTPALCSCTHNLLKRAICYFSIFII